MAVRPWGSGSTPRLREHGRMWKDRGHFFAAAAEAMRHILVDQARRKRRPKHGGHRRCVEFDDAVPVPPEAEEDLLALDEALTRLAADDPEAGCGRSVTLLCRAFGGTGCPEPRHVARQRLPSLDVRPRLVAATTLRSSRGVIRVTIC